MSYRPVASHARNISLNQPSAAQQEHLQARVAEKRAELASLRELQALSATVADQMQMLEGKLATLADGTEAVATVLANWHSILRAIHMASSKLPKPKGEDVTEAEEDLPLPQTLVRIPTEHAPMIQQSTSGNAAD